MRGLLHVVLWLALTASVAFAQDAGTGVLTKAPALLKKVDAPFPPDMVDAGVGGTVVMQIDVGADGKVSDAVVVQSAGKSFDDAALSAIRQFEFSPAEVDGVPAPVRIQFSQQFFFRPQVVEVAVDAGAPPGTVNFTGVLLERGTRVPLVGARIIVGGGEAPLETFSDDQGAFSLPDVPLGELRVLVQEPDHQPYDVKETFVAGQRTQVTYYVRRKTYGGMETVVRDKRERKEVTQVALKQEEIRLIPGTNGDAFRVVQNLPGVARTPFGLGFLIVRGGKPFDTKVYIDEAQVPVLFHFGGIFSTYNTSLLQEITFQQGNFNSDYGRAIGGFVQGTGKTPSQQGLHGYFDINVVDTSVMLETPIANDWSVAIASRRSYIDALLPTVLKLIPGATDAVTFTVAPKYFDYQVRLEWKPKNGKQRFFISLFGSNDELVAALPNPSLDPEGRAQFGTSIIYNRLLFGYDHKLSDRFSFRTRTSFGVDDWSFTLGSDIFLKNRQYPILTRDTLSIALPEIRSSLQVGADLSLLPYSIALQAPPPTRPDQIPDPFASRTLQTQRSTVYQFEGGLFVDALIKPVESLRIMAGVRADYHALLNAFWVDPRVSALWQINSMFALKGAAGIYRQGPDYRAGQLTEKFGNPNLKPEGARHYMVGLETRFTDAISLDVQLYYKDLFNQARSTNATSSNGDFSMSTTTRPYASFGFGRSFGAEILLRHALTKNFFGWISYTLSKTERDYRGNTKFGPSQFDQPHNLVVVASYKLPRDFIVGARVRYTSGPLDTPVVGTVYDVNGNYYYPVLGEPNSRRLPDFFQLDVRIDKRFVFDTWMLALYLDVQNVTNNRNVEGVLNNFDYSQEAFLQSLPILPVLGVRGEW